MKIVSCLTIIATESIFVESLIIVEVINFNRVSNISFAITKLEAVFDIIVAKDEHFDYVFSFKLVNFEKVIIILKFSSL